MSLLLKCLYESKERFENFKNENWRVYAALSDAIQKSSLSKDEQKKILALYQEQENINMADFKLGLSWLKASVEELETNQLK